MDFRKLHHCLVVAELGSFTRAASHLSVPQSVLSRQVRDVEQELGVALLHRTGRGVVPTEAGHQMFPRVAALVRDGRRLLEDARRLKDTPAGLIRLGMLTSLTPIVLTPLLAAAAERLPDVRLHVMEGLTDHLDELLLSGRLDISLLYNNRMAAFPTDETLMYTDLCLIGAAGDAATAAATTDLADLAQLELTLPALPNRMRLTVDQVCREQGIKLNVTTELDSVTAMKEIAASGKVHTVLPPHFVAMDVRMGRLQASRLVNPPITRSVLLAMASNQPVRRAGQEVASLVRETILALIRAGTLPGRIHIDDLPA